MAGQAAGSCVEPTFAVGVVGVANSEVSEEDFAWVRVGLCFPEDFNPRISDAVVVRDAASSKNAIGFVTAVASAAFSSAPAGGRQD